MPRQTVVWAWRELFGLTGIMLAVRLYYVSLATAGAAVAYRLLRPSFHPLAALAGVSIPLLAPPYHLLAPTYNTTAALAFTLAVAFGVAAIRDRRAGFAVAFGCAIVLGSAVAVIRRHIRLHAYDAARLQLLAQDGEMISREESLELVLQPPLHAVEVPDRPLRIRRRL